MTRRRKILVWSLAGFAALVLAATVAGILVVRGAWFHDQVRSRMIREIEKSSGGKAELGSFDFDWKTMTAEARGFVLHGREKPGEPIFLKVARISIGLKIVSALKKEIDLASAVIDQPEFHLLVYPDGSTNLPVPAVHTGGTPIDTLLRLKVRHYEVRNGVVEFREERIPLDIRGDNLNAALDYDSGRASYRGHLSSRQLHVQAPKLLPLVGDFNADFAFDKNGIEFPKLTFAWPKSHIELAGALTNWNALRGAFDVNASLSLAELGDVLRVPIEHRGDASFQGKMQIAFSPKFDYDLRGAVTGRNLAARFNSVEVAPVAVDGDAILTAAGLELPHAKLSALGGTFNGRVSLPEFKTFTVAGETAGLSIAQAAQFGSRRKLPWSGTLSGPLELAGDIGPKTNLRARANLVIMQAPGGIPVDGLVDVAYDQRAGTVDLANSRISTPNSRLIVSGTLGRTLQVSARTSDLNDVLPVLALISENPPAELPVKIEPGGSVSTDATITGPLADPAIAGHMSAEKVVAEKQHIDQISTDFEVAQSRLFTRNLAFAQAGMKISGTAEIGLVNWKPVDSSRISAALDVSNADLKTLLAQAGSTIEITGTASARVQAQGTYGSPAADVQLTVDHPAGFGESFDRLVAAVRYAGSSVDIKSSELRLGSARILATGNYTRAGADWTQGDLRFNISSTGLRLEQFKCAQLQGRSVSAGLILKVSGHGSIRNRNFDLNDLDSQAELRGLSIEGTPVGDATVIARTHERNLNFELSGNLRESKVTGSGAWRLEGDYPGRGEIRISQLSFGTLQRVAAAAGETTELPFQGRIQGSAVIAGPLKKPDDLKADVNLTSIELRPADNQRIRTAIKGADLVLRNTEPVSFTATNKSVVIRSAKFAAKDTNIQASGRVTFDSKSPWDLKVNGSMNMAILQLFNADLVAQGNAVVDTTVTGALNDPQVNGRLELRGASLYLGDLITGVDNANGLVTFDRGRATIQRLTAEVGGGRVAFGGFIGFNSGLLLYRVQASADQVRIRYPEGVSTTMNAQLNLTGTSANSLVAGTVTIARAGFTPKADLGSLLAQSAKPISAPTAPNEYLRNIQLDVRIESGPSLQFQTSLTRDLEAEADLRLRGNLARPTLLGNVSVNQGEVNLFDTKYTINRGDIRFLNPTRIDPVFDIDLETQARGITVNISLSGTLNKLNLTYRSDPPLQTSEIIALIAVGRDPATSAALAGSQITQNSMLQAGGNVLGQALAAPVTSRLQRFFGISRLKIDPQLTGVENVPQARLTLEQQVSRDITLTYITNLTRTQEQIVRIQWDISKDWSAIAVREENGVFGIDFQYRKRFK